MDILNIPAEVTKEIFTAKAGGKYVGCVRMVDYICFTAETFDSALKAANKARNLKRRLSQQNGTQLEKKSVPTNSSSLKVKKKVVYHQRLFSLPEIKVMPLLQFKEVWVILKDNQYVSDCLNKKEKKLVSYSAKCSEAKLFKYHDEAKSMITTLKGVLGPGFELARFFIQNED